MLKNPSMTATLRIAHLYPDYMNIYGDRGNMITLKQRCAWRGIATEVVAINPGMQVDWELIDIAFFGGGQDSGQALIAADFVQQQGSTLRQAIDAGLVMLSICGGYQLLGHYFLTHTGEKLPGIGALDVHTVGGDVRLIGNIVVDWVSQRQLVSQSYTTSDSHRGSADRGLQSADPRPMLVGFENHSGRTYLGTGVAPLGRVISGHGNNGEDGTEGAVYRNSYGCYMHGSLLPKNPHFADHLIGLALQRRYGIEATLIPLDDRYELRAQQAMVGRLVPSRA
jgi:lipid II isoglutaminyl synthase (glutamine-hydrolysing)